VDGDRDFSDNTAKSKIFTSLSTDFTYPVVKVRPQGATELRSDPDLPAVRWSVASSCEDTEQWTDRVVRCGARGDGGDEETRTPDPLLAKEMLCQLSYVPVDPRAREVWWAFLDSNQRPLPYQGSALTS
jgi:hypothetical protein